MAELERRVAAVTAAETHEEAAAVLADLPALASDPTPGTGARTRWGRGHGDADAPAAGWRPTTERFRDPRTNRVMRVWEDPPASGTTSPTTTVADRPSPQRRRDPGRPV